MALQINFPALETVNFINTTFHSKGHTYLVLLKVSRYHGKYLIFNLINILLKVSRYHGKY